MKSVPVILCLAMCIGGRALSAESEPFRLQLNSQDKVSLDLAALVSGFYEQRDASQSIVNQRPQNEILKPPVEIAVKLSFINAGMVRRQAEEILGGGWFEIGGEHWNSGYRAEYMNRAFPHLVVLVWYGWTERRVVDGHLIRNAGPDAQVRIRPALVETKQPLPNAQ